MTLNNKITVQNLFVPLFCVIIFGIFNTKRKSMYLIPFHLDCEATPTNTPHYS